MLSRVAGVLDVAGWFSWLVTDGRRYGYLPRVELLGEHYGCVSLNTWPPFLEIAIHLLVL